MDIVNMFWDYGYPICVILFSIWFTWWFNRRYERIGKDNKKRK